MRLQLATLPQVRKQCEADTNDAMENIDTTIKDYRQIFEDTMEIWASLQEDPHVQKIQAKIYDKQQQSDEIKVMMQTLAPT